MRIGSLLGSLANQWHVRGKIAETKEEETKSEVPPYLKWRLRGIQFSSSANQTSYPSTAATPMLLILHTPSHSIYQNQDFPAFCSIPEHDALQSVLSKELKATSFQVLSFPILLLFFSRRATCLHPSDAIRGLVAKGIFTVGLLQVCSKTHTPWLFSLAQISKLGNTCYTSLPVLAVLNSTCR